VLLLKANFHYPIPSFIVPFNFYYMFLFVFVLSCFAENNTFASFSFFFSFYFAYCFLASNTERRPQDSVHLPA